MRRTERAIRSRVTVAAVLSIIGMTTLTGVAGMAVGSAPAGALSTNLVTNGSFETLPNGTTLPGSGFQPVVAGGSTTIPGWTVVTPSTSSGPNPGSVDVVSDTYSTVPGSNWNAEDGHYSIDLAGLTPGGLYQDVPTTVGATYTLSYYTAVNGDQARGTNHTVTVNVTGQSPVTITEAGVGEPLAWVLHSTTIVATSSTTRIEFDDTTMPSDQNQGPTLDNVSLTPVADSITASPATIAPKTTGVAFTAPVTTFTDTNTSAPAGSFSASIAWGDGTAPTNGSVTGSGGSYAVSGTHTYATHGSYTVGVRITSAGGGAASVSDSVSVADAVTTCSRSGCNGSVTTTQQTLALTSTSTSGTILTTVDPADQGGYSCGDAFRHAPQITTVTDTGLNANIVYTITFKNKSAAGQWFTPFAVCYQAQTPFKDLYGHTVTTGLLPLCSVFPRPGKPLVAPCVQSITELPLFLGNVVEKIVVPVGDPRFH